LVVLDEKSKKCILDLEALRGVHYAIKSERALSTAEKNALWQEIVAALNRRQCVPTEIGDELIKGEWVIS